MIGPLEILVIIGAVLIVVGVVVSSVIARQKAKKTGNVGCSGCCGSCTGCPSANQKVEVKK